MGRRTVMWTVVALAVATLTVASCGLEPAGTAPPVLVAGGVVKGWTTIGNGGSWLALVRLPQGTCVAVLVGYSNAGKAMMVVPDKECQ